MNKNFRANAIGSENFLNDSTLEDKFNDKKTQISSLVSYSINTLKSVEEYLNYLKRCSTLKQIYINATVLYQSNQPIRIKYKNLIDFSKNIVGLNAKEFKQNINDYISNKIMAIKTKVDKIFTHLINYIENYESNVKSLCNKKISSYMKSIIKKAQGAKNFSDIKQQIPIKCYVDNRKQNQLHMITSTNYFSNSNKKKIV